LIVALTEATLMIGYSMSLISIVVIKAYTPLLISKLIVIASNW